MDRTNMRNNQNGTFAVRIRTMYFPADQAPPPHPRKLYMYGQMPVTAGSRQKQVRTVAACELDELDGPARCCGPSDCSSYLRGEEWRKKKEKRGKTKHTVALFIPDGTVHRTSTVATAVLFTSPGLL